MFILSRRIGETVCIGDEIEVTLVAVQFSQHQVRLGISAPRAVGVYRKELLEAITDENLLAAATPNADQLPDALSLPRRTTPKSE